MTFVKIEQNVIVTTTSTLQFLVTGDVQLQVIANKPVVMINGADSCVHLNRTTGTPSCVTDVNLCTDGFTFSIDVNFGQLLDNTYIVSSGGHLPGHSGITLYYNNKQLIYIVSTSTQIWTLVVQYQPVLNKWQHFELTWNKHLGVELLIDGHSLGSNSRPAGQPITTQTVDLSFGCSHTSINVDKEMNVTNFNMWSIDRTELVNAGILEPKMPSTTLKSYLNQYTTTPTVATASTSGISEQHLHFEDAISAKCTRYGWNISLDLNSLHLLYPGITPNDIYLSSEKCNGTLHRDELWFQQNFESCRTRKEVTEGTDVFRNVLFYATFDPFDPTIVRQHYWTYNIACYVSRGEETSSHLHHQVESHSTNITAQHDLTLTFFKDRNFLHQVPDNPLRVTVGDNIYVRVSTSVPDWNTKMRLHTCSTRFSDSTVAEHVLIRDGCEVDSSTHIISQSTHETKFVFRDFEYLTFNEGLDVFCNATFCDTSDYSPTCTQACKQSPSIVG
ncbi:uncharacterized protein LOC128559582 isoform X2 [Mercenaria mercenaria]|uniref:uncharacterized protein LOC128559582 isoform X2 n=1 Tax=Mercenaria mercenaria TaxID=6596 RepID=UPI00234F8D34|nr:uncharacterized protein LOC128559582 isoform X2 [Mercenaria mercenaria]